MLQKQITFNLDTGVPCPLLICHTVFLWLIDKIISFSPKPSNNWFPPVMNRIDISLSRMMSFRDCFFCNVWLRTNLKDQRNAAWQMEMRTKYFCLWIGGNLSLHIRSFHHSLTWTEHNFQTMDGWQSHITFNITDILAACDRIQNEPHSGT